MFGVILWSDPEVRKAVIWCEDHGDLAYYEATENAANRDELFFDAGDYVEFDITEEKDLRRASNAQTILTASYPMSKAPMVLPEVSPDVPPVQPIPETVAPLSADVIQFADHAQKRRTQGRVLSRRG
ncbi:MAG: hypothetical protein AB8B71_06585 [Paracoccaceae bacterium]